MIVVAALSGIILTSIWRVAVIYIEKRMKPQEPVEGFNAIKTCIVLILSFVISAAAFQRFGLATKYWMSFCLLGVSLITGYQDLKYHLVEDEPAFFLIAAGILFAFINQSGFKEPLFGFLLGGGLLFLIAVVTRGGMGGADIKLMAAYGIFLGYKLTLMALFIGFLSGSIVSLLLIVLKKKGRKDVIAFSPYLSIGTMAAFLFGEALQNIYLNYILG